MIIPAEPPPLNEYQRHLVESHIHKVRGAAQKESRRFWNRPDKRAVVEELENYMLSALCYAASHYDASHASGAKFWTYAYAYMKTSVRQMIIDSRLWRTAKQKPLSLDGKRIQIGDTRSASLGTHETQEELTKILSVLSPLQRLIIRLRNGHSVPMGILAATLGVSRQRVDQLHSQAVRKLQWSYPNAALRTKEWIGKNDEHIPPCPAVAAMLEELKSYRQKTSIRTRCGRKKELCRTIE